MPEPGYGRDRNARDRQGSLTGSPEERPISGSQVPDRRIPAHPALTKPSCWTWSELSPAPRPDRCSYVCQGAG